MGSSATSSPFVRADDRRLLPRTWSLRGRALGWCEGADVLARVRAGTRRLQRPPRHALEDLGDSAWRLREVLRRRSEASTPASSETLASMTEEERAGSFHHKKVGPRAAIVAAGPIANFILAIVIFTCLFTFFGKPSTTARVDKIEASSAAERAGFQVGDVVLAIDGKKIGSFSDMQRFVSVRAGDTLTFTVKRGDSTLQLKGTPELREVKDPFGNAQRLGILGITRATTPGEATTEKVDPATALWLGVKETWFVIDQTLAYIGNIFTGRASADQIGGPIRIAQISGQVATLGIIPLLHLAAVLSISIGLLNLFRFPCSMAVTFCSTRRRCFEAVLCRKNPRNTGSAWGWCWS